MRAGVSERGVDGLGVFGGAAKLPKAAAAAKSGVAAVAGGEAHVGPRAVHAWCCRAGYFGPMGAARPEPLVKTSGKPDGEGQSTGKGWKTS